MKLSVFQSLHESYFSLQTAHVKVWWQGRDQQVLGEFVRRFRMYIWNQKMLILPLWGPLLEKFLRMRCSIIGEGWGFSSLKRANAKGDDGERWALLSDFVRLNEYLFPELNDDIYILRNPNWWLQHLCMPGWKRFKNLNFLKNSSFFWLTYCKKTSKYDFLKKID